MDGVFHQKSCIDRLYLKWKDGGHGLISVADSICEEEFSLFNYVKASEKWMLKVVGDTLVTGEFRWDCKKHIEVECKQRLHEKRLHGNFFWDVKDVVASRSWQ